MVVLAVLVAVVAVGSPVSADPIYTASVGISSDGIGCGAASNTDSAGVDAQVNSAQGCLNVVGGAFARSGPAGLGASADLINYDRVGGAGATADVATDFIIAGPVGNVTLSLNLELSFSIDGGTTNDFNERLVQATVIIAGVNFFRGTFVEQANQDGIVTAANGSLPISGVCASPCGIRTPDFTVAANVLHPFSMFLVAAVSGRGESKGSADASHTLYFPLAGPVFNLPDGYTADIIGLNVADNRVIGPGDPQVPEPSTLLLLGGGLLGSALGGRRRRCRV